jgi:hypothetical protein
LERLDPDRAAALEADFRERVNARLEEARSFSDGSGHAFEGRARRDESLASDLAQDVEELMRSAGVHDELLVDRVPRGWRARWEVRTGGLIFKRTALVVEAGVVHPFSELIRRAPATPCPRAEAARVLTPDHGANVPRVAVVLGSSGWRTDGDVPESESTSVFLVEPAPGGGYKVAAGPAEALPSWLALESPDEMAARVAAWVTASRVDLVLRGLEARLAAKRTGVPVEVVEEAFRDAARKDEFLRLTDEGDTVVLRRA